MFETIALAFQGIWNHKMRSLLTMLGIIIGIAAIITIVSTIKGTNDQIKQNLIGSGDNVVKVSLRATDGGYYDSYSGTLPDSVSLITEDIRQGLLEQDGIKDAALYISREWVDGVFYGNTAFNGNLTGIDANYLRVMNYGINFGRGFTAEDFEENRKVVIIDVKTMTTLFEGRNPIGQIIEIMGEPFTVVGVAAKKAGSGVVINSVSDYYMYADTSSGSMFVPIDSWATIYKFDEGRQVVVKATTTDDMTTAGNSAATYLTKKVIKGSGYAYEADNLLEQAQALQDLSSATSQQLIWIAGISLLVGGIGVMNIMLVSVTERTREIGLKKAIGAKNRRIRFQFLTESAVLTSLGGVFGVAAGLGLAKMISNIMGVPVAVSVPACAVAVIFSMVIGIIFGFFPAVKASKLNPIDALRRD